MVQSTHKLNRLSAAGTYDEPDARRRAWGPYRYPVSSAVPSTVTVPTLEQIQKTIAKMKASCPPPQRTRIRVGDKLYDVDFSMLLFDPMKFLTGCSTYVARPSDWQIYGGPLA